MRGHRLVAMVEPMHLACGKGKMRDVGEKDGGDAVTVEIERGNCWHDYPNGEERQKRDIVTDPPLVLPDISPSKGEIGWP